MTAAAAAAATAPVQRGSLRNAQAAIAMYQANADGVLQPPAWTPGPPVDGPATRR